MVNRHDFGLFRQRLLLPLCKRDGTVRCSGMILQGRSGRLGCLLPRNEIAMVLHRRNDDFVSGFRTRRA